MYRSEKMRFSMVTDDVRQQIHHIRSAILFGIESHVCVLQTCLELLDAGIDVHVLADGVSSMNSSEIDIALNVHFIPHVYNQINTFDVENARCWRCSHHVRFDFVSVVSGCES